MLVSGIVAAGVPVDSQYLSKEDIKEERKGYVCFRVSAVYVHGNRDQSFDPDCPLDESAMKRHL